MKPILIKKQKRSKEIRIAAVIVFLIVVVSFILSIKYAGVNKRQFPVLSADNKIPAPYCPEKAGFYPDIFSITLSDSSSGSEIYYTLDGSEPDLGSKLYSKPILIQDITPQLNKLSDIPTSPRWKPPVGDVFKGVILRAVAVKAENKKSRELIRTFFVNEKVNKRYSFPVISITINPDDLFGYKKGIYILGEKYEDKSTYIEKQIPLDIPWWAYPSNYLQKGENAERPAHIEFFEPDGKLGFEQNAGIRINGNKTRGFSQKSLRICFDKKYGCEKLHYKLFPDYNVEEFNSFILRNSGNDWDKTMFRDAFMQELMINSKLEIQSYRPSIVFINGEYWGIHNIRERFDENYFANKFHLSTDSIVILESGGKLLFGKKNDPESFKKLLVFVKTHDLAIDSNYKYVERNVDLENFMDFIIANVYFCNTDWQEKFWKYRAALPAGDSLDVKDGRWRWVLYDTDWGFGFSGKNAVNTDLLEVARKTGSVGVIFGGLLKNKLFLERFRKRFLYALDNTFKTEVVIKKINEFESSLAPEMTEHINRWRSIGSYENWKSNVQELKDFALKRQEIQRKQLDDFYNRLK